MAGIHVGSTPPSDTDVVIIGAGFAGLYAIYELRARGFSVQAVEAAPDVGGTWYWNCYPGSRCDVEALDYCYSFSPDLMRDWIWSERFATQPEVLRYINHVADRFDLRKHVSFNTRVTGAHFKSPTRRWLVSTDRHEEISAKVVISAMGCFSALNKPDFEGSEAYKGEWYRTAAWPSSGVDFRGKRVGIIGTGSSGVQSIPLIAEQAAHLTVFQRTANFSMPAVNGPIDPGYEANVRSDYAAHRWRSLQSHFASPNLCVGGPALEVSEEERNATYEAKWRSGGAGGIIVCFSDTFLNLQSNDTAAEFVRQKIRSIVKDPATAELLCPKDHPIGTKRPCLDTNYYETYNRPNVSLVNLRDEPIDRLTVDGLKTTAAEYPLDVIVFATGFDAVTGPLLAIDVTGLDGMRLKDAWKNGPVTNLGLMVTGFPNFFMLTGPGSPSVLANVVAAIEQHVRWVAGCLEFMREAGHELIDADANAQEDWTAEVRRIAELSLYPLSISWYNGDNIPGKPRVFLAYIGGYPAYAARCAAVAEGGYKGFRFAAANLNFAPHTGIRKPLSAPELTPQQA